MLYYIFFYFSKFDVFQNKATSKIFSNKLNGFRIISNCFLVFLKSKDSEDLAFYKFYSSMKNMELYFYLNK